MKATQKQTLQNVMNLAWQFARQNGLNLSDALRLAWRNIKLRDALSQRIVKFYFQKIDGTIREAYGTLADSKIPATAGTDRRANNTVQTYFDTEKQAWRCFKKANLISIQ